MSNAPIFAINHDQLTFQLVSRDNLPGFSADNVLVCDSCDLPVAFALLPLDDDFSDPRHHCRSCLVRVLHSDFLHVLAPVGVTDDLLDSL